MACGKAICSLCRKEWGYFCSEACKATKRSASADLEPAESREEMAAIREKVQKWMHLVRFRIIPVIAVIAAIWIGHWIMDSSGELVWEWQPEGDKTLSHMILAEDTIYAGCAGGRLYAIDATSGKERWRLETQADLSVGVPQLVDEDTCLTWGEAEVIAADVTDGSQVWLHKVEGKIDPPLLSAEGAVCLRSSTWKNLEIKSSGDSGFGASLGSLFGGPERPIKVRDKTLLTALDPATGRVLWQREVHYSGAAGSLVAMEDLICLRRSSLQVKKGGNSPPGTGIAALDGQTGKERWHADLGMVSAMETTPAGLLVKEFSRLTLVSPAGKTIWSRAMDQAGSARVMSGHICSVSNAGEAVCLALSTGEEVWSRELGKGTVVSFAGKGEVFYAVAGKDPPPEKSTDPAYDLKALNLSDGTLLWQADWDDDGVLTHGAYLFCLNVEGGVNLIDQEMSERTRIFAHDPDDGDALWLYFRKGFFVNTEADEERFYFRMHQSGGSIVPSFTSDGSPPSTRGNYIGAVSAVW